MAENQRGFQFPEGYPQYFGETMKSEYLTDIPERIAEFLEGEHPQLSMTQLKAFYIHARRAENAWRHGMPLADAVNEIKKLEALAHDRLAKGRITQTFHDFLRKNAAYVVAGDDGRTLTAFLDHFQALVGFCAGRLSERERT